MDASAPAGSDVAIDLQEMCQLQLSEVELLSSMFSNQGEFVLDDPSSIIEMQDFIDGKVESVHSRIGFTVNIHDPDSEEDVIEMVCHLPHEYPAISPEILTRASFLSKSQHRQFSEDLLSFIFDQDKNDIIVGTIIQWIQENIKSYKSTSSQSLSPKKHKPTKAEIKDSKFSRMWIYSHHIYSKIKRKDMLALSSDLNLTGFTLPGKPGIIVVEGYSHCVEEFWGTVRRWQWKKLTMKEKEDYDIGCKTVDELRKFPNYEEKNFDARSGRGREVHMNLGLLYQYLEEKGCAHIFPLYFGVDGKSQLEDD